MFLRDVVLAENAPEVGSLLGLIQELSRVRSPDQVLPDADPKKQKSETLCLQLNITVITVPYFIIY